MARSAEILVEVCSFAGTGNVLKVQKMLQICGEHAEKPKPETDGEGEAVGAGGDDAAASGATDEAMDQDQDASASAGADAAGSTEEKEKEAERKAKEMKKQSMATIGIALIAMGEEVGAEMALRQFQHLVSIPSSNVH